MTPAQGVISRGDIWIAVWPNGPTHKSHPVLVVSNAKRNLLSRILDILVVKLTSRDYEDGTIKPINLAEDIEFKMKKESIIQCGQIFTLPKHTLQKKLQACPANIMHKVDECLKTALGVS